MSQKPTQPKNSASISKAIAEHQKAKLAIEFEKLKKLENDQIRADRLENRRKALLPPLSLTAKQSSPKLSPSAPSTPKTPSFILPSLDDTHFTFNLSPNIDIKCGGHSQPSLSPKIIFNEPFEILVREEPIEVLINQQIDSDVAERDDLQDVLDRKQVIDEADAIDGFLADDEYDGLDLQNENDLADVARYIARNEVNEDALIADRIDDLNDDRIDGFIDREIVQVEQQLLQPVHLYQQPAHAADQSASSAESDVDSDQENNARQVNQGQIFVIPQLIDTDESSGEMAEKLDCPKFAGLRHDDSEDFLTTFDWYVVRKNVLTEQQKIAHMIGHLQDAAARWAKALTFGPVVVIPPEPAALDGGNADGNAIAAQAALLQARALAQAQAAEPNTVRTYDQFKTAFRRQYGRGVADNWRDQASLWAAKQGADESVEKYITDMQRKATAAGIEVGQQKGLIINGLLPDIKEAILLRDIDTIEQLRKWALVAQDIQTAKKQRLAGDMDDKFRRLEAKLDELREIKTLSLDAMGKPSAKTVDDSKQGEQPRRDMGFNSRRNSQRQGQRGPYQQQQTQQQQPQSQYQQPQQQYQQQYQQNYPPLQPVQQQPGPQNSWDRQSPLEHRVEGYQRGPRICFFCGGPYDHGRMNCPAWGKICEICQKPNHIAAACRQGRFTTPRGGPPQQQA